MRVLDEARGIAAGAAGGGPDAGRARPAGRAVRRRCRWLVGLAAGQPADGAAASFGGLAGLSVPQAPYRYRARVVAAVGLGLALAVLFGGLAARHGLLAALVAGVVSAVASFVCQAAELPPPRELMLVMAVLAATDLAAGPADAVRRAGLAAAGALLAWLITMSPALLGRRREPERRAVAAAVGAVADLLDADRFPGRGGGPARGRRWRSAGPARAVEQGALPAEHPLARTAVAAGGGARGRPARGRRGDRAAGPPAGGGPCGRCGREPAGPAEPLPADRSVTGVRPAGPGDHRRPGGGGRHSRRPPSRDRRCGPGPGIGPQLAAAVRRHSVVLPAAARIGVAVAVGGRARSGARARARLLGRADRGRGAAGQQPGGHPAAGSCSGWSAPCSASGWPSRCSAGAHRCGWRCWPPRCCQALVELVISTHYGLAVVGITVLALVLFHIGAPDGGRRRGDRGPAAGHRARGRARAAAAPAAVAAGHLGPAAAGAGPGGGRGAPGVRRRLDRRR